MPPSPLSHTLTDRLAHAPPGALRVGFSGGLDSTALLHALAALPAARARGLAAIHVDHGLHPDAALWSQHCARFCAAHAIGFEAVRVQVAAVAELGLEAAARRARHDVFHARLPPGAVLVLAHHRDDQAETLLLRLLHGAGHEGLAGMRDVRAFAPGMLWRPLLDTPRVELAAYAAEHRLDWIEDPANLDTIHARTHLRHVVMPALQARWPDAARRIATAATRLRDESAVLDGAAATALAACQGIDPATLSLPTLRGLDAALRRLVVGRWLDQLGLPRPPPGVWSRLGVDLLDARDDATPRLAWRGAELRRHRDAVFALKPLPAVATDWSMPWDGVATLVLPDGFGRLALEPATAIGRCIVRPRQGGERLQQPGVRRELRTLLQDLGVPPWTRARMPLLFDADGELLAAADLALAPAFAQQLRDADTRLRWQADA